jgi:hypothetical protein
MLGSFVVWRANDVTGMFDKVCFPLLSLLISQRLWLSLFSMSAGELGGATQREHNDGQQFTYLGRRRTRSSLLFLSVQNIVINDVLVLI